MNIRLASDLELGKDQDLSIAGYFTSNSFSSVESTFGLQYGVKKRFMLRGGFTYEDNLFDDALRTTVYSGLSAGMTVDLPLGSGGKKFGIDYSYRSTQPWDGIHSFGFRFIL